MTIFTSVLILIRVPDCTKVKSLQPPVSSIQGSTAQPSHKTTALSCMPEARLRCPVSRSTHYQSIASQDSKSPRGLQRFKFCQAPKTQPYECRPYRLFHANRGFPVAANSAKPFRPHRVFSSSSVGFKPQNCKIKDLLECIIVAPHAVTQIRVTHFSVLCYIPRIPFE